MEGETGKRLIEDWRKWVWSTIAGKQEAAETKLIEW
jgi:hypothetical protein